MTDNELLDLLELDKEAGFRMLMGQYQEQIYWHIRRMVTLHQDADDVVQNTFVKVYRNIEKFNRDSKLYTWLYRIATNESLTHLRKRNNRKTTSMDDELHNTALKIKADNYFDGNQAELVLQQAIVSLPDKQKAVFNLRYYDEMSYADMSEMLGTSVGALKASYHHAVKKVEAFIKKEDI